MVRIRFLGLRRVVRLLSVTSLPTGEMPDCNEVERLGVIFSSGSFVTTSFFFVRGGCLGVSAPRTLNGGRTNLSLFALVDNGESVL